MEQSAQGSSAPTSGASNAEDFQPPTQNPQSTGTSLQQPNSTQNTSGLDVLTNTDARIIVPTTNPAPPSAVAPDTSSGLNGWVVLVILLVIVVIGAALWRRAKSSYGVARSFSDMTDSFSEPTESTPAQMSNVQEKPSPAKKKKSKKSKSKRKKSRK